MSDRTTAILGAGTVLDFDFTGIEKPTTSNITKICKEQKIQDFNNEELYLIRHIYDKIVDVAKLEYKKHHYDVRSFSPNITFEDLFEVIETLYSYNSTWRHEHYPISIISALVKSDLNFESIEYYNSLIAIVRTIINIVNAYDERFRINGRESWYKVFWKEFKGRLDVFNFNYDTTIETSLGEFNDGFVRFAPNCDRFEPDILWNADDSISSVNHLHGCIFFADLNPSITENYYSHRDLYKLYSVKDVLTLLGHYWMPHNQVGDYIFYTPIITGLKKTDKICYMPHSIYHANLVKKIIENPSLLICGYSFGDLYANQILERHKLIHDKNQKVVIVDKWPDYVNDSNVRLYRYYMDHTSEGLKEFVARIIEGGNAPLDIFKQFNHLHDGCWESSNGTLRLYTKGMKHAVVNYQNDIMDFLQKHPS